MASAAETETVRSALGGHGVEGAGVGEDMRNVLVRVD